MCCIEVKQHQELHAGQRTLELKQALCSLQPVVPEGVGVGVEFEAGKSGFREAAVIAADIPLLGAPLDDRGAIAARLPSISNNIEVS